LVTPYLAAIDTTLKELDAELTQSRLMTPYIDRVTRILERLEQREAREHPCPVPLAPVPLPQAEHTTGLAARVPVPPVRAHDTLHRYFRNTNSPPSGEADHMYDEHDTVQPARQDAPPTRDGPPRRWFHTAAGEWIDLAQLDPVDWEVASANLANSVALLQPPSREDHTARNVEYVTQLEPPAESFITVDRAESVEDTVGYSDRDENTMTAGDSKVVEYIPQLVDHTEPSLSGASPSTPSAYDWRTDTGRGYSAAHDMVISIPGMETRTTRWGGSVKDRRSCSP